MRSDGKTDKVELKTLVLGASTNPSRYAYIATSMLHEAGHEFELVGRRPGAVFGKEIKLIKEKVYGDTRVSFHEFL